jgi:succinate dehydrogenase / fumarate reductase cytochrome b subunit
MSARTQYFAKKLFEVTGFLPIGGFLLEHFYSNYQAVGPGGKERFDEVVRSLQTNPLIIWLEIFVIALPLLYHAAYGILVAKQARPNNGEYGYLRNWTYLFQRVTGGILLAYIIYHVWNTRLYPHFARPDHPLYRYLLEAGNQKLVSSDYMSHYLAEKHLGLEVIWIYVVGVACAVYHFVNGIWNVGIHWGITVSPKSQRLSGVVCGMLGVALLAVGLASLLAFKQMGA